MDAILLSGDRMVKVSNTLDPWEVRWVAAIATERHHGGPQVDARALAARRLIPVEAYCAAARASSSVTVMAGLLEVPMQAVLHRYFNFTGPERILVEQAPAPRSVPRPAWVPHYCVAIADTPAQADQASCCPPGFSAPGAVTVPMRAIPAPGVVTVPMRAIPAPEGLV